MSKNKFIKTVILSMFIVLGINNAVAKSSTYGQNNNSPFMKTFGESIAPMGFKEFCKDNVDYCKSEINKPKRSKITQTSWIELNRINEIINRKIKPVSDFELYQIEEKWAFPEKVGAGDCEDYVLLKKKILIDRGWDKESLLITVVADENGEGHAVLTVATDMGDLVLDNKTDKINLWIDTPYEFHTRQSQIHPYLWVALNPYATKDTATAVNY